MNLRELLRPSLARTHVSVDNWESAIRAAGQLLVEDGAVEPRFVDAMVRVAQELGPYIVVAPGIALPHARPEDGVNRASISAISLKTPVEFGHEKNDPVSLVIALAAEDNKQHVQGLADLATVLGKSETVSRLNAAETKEELLAILWGDGGDDSDGKEG